MNYKEYFICAYEDFVNAHEREPNIEECRQIRKDFVCLMEGICEIWRKKFEKDGE